MRDSWGKDQAIHVGNRCFGELRCLSTFRTAAMNYAASLDLPSVGRKKCTIDCAGGNQSSDDDLLLLRAAGASSLETRR
jgi:hypothetical protein